MPKLVIVSPSVRKGRKSHRIALYFNNLIKETALADTEILDLLVYNFPIFNERLKYQDSPSPETRDFADKVRSADGVIIITPEYNGGPPASLKNAIDLLTDEWRRKPVAFVTVSDGSFAGTQSVTQLQFILWKMGALTVNTTMRLPNISAAFDDNGIPADKTGIDKKGVSFINELLWHIESNTRMSEK